MNYESVEGCIVHLFPNVYILWPLDNGAAPNVIDDEALAIERPRVIGLTDRDAPVATYHYVPHMHRWEREF